MVKMEKKDTLQEKQQEKQHNKEGFNPSFFKNYNIYIKYDIRNILNKKK